MADIVESTIPALSGQTRLGGLARRIAELACIDPDNSVQPVPPPGGLLVLHLGGRR